jgi:hypothetical protein
MLLAGNVILAVTREVIPPPLFLTNAIARGDISTDKDPDGILRRARAFRTYRSWHPLFRQVEADPEYGVDLRRARVEPRRIVLPRTQGDDIFIPLDEEGNFELADFVGDTLPPGLPAKRNPLPRNASGTWALCSPRGNWASTLTARSWTLPTAGSPCPRGRRQTNHPRGCRGLFLH